MMIIYCILLATVALGLLLFWSLYQPLPHDLLDRPQIRKFFTFYNAVLVYGKLRSLFGHPAGNLSFRGLEKRDYVESPRTDKDVKFYDTHLGTEEQVRVRIYESSADISQSAQPKAAIIFIHGGGWCLGSVEAYHRLVLELCTFIGCTIISVDYRRTPEHPFPTPFNDCLSVVKFVFENAETYNIDTNRVALMGDSSGGNLSAAVCLKLRDINFQFRPRLQVLVYPLLQALDFRSPSYTDPYPMLISPHVVAEFFLHYAGLDGRDWQLRQKIAESQHVSKDVKQKYAQLIKFLPEEFRKGYTPCTTGFADEALCTKVEKYITDPYMNPLIAESHSDLPEAYVWTADRDGLRDEGVMYAEKLKQDGVQVTRVNVPNAMHGCYPLPFPEITKFRHESFQFIKDKLSS